VKKEEKGKRKTGKKKTNKIFCILFPVLFPCMYERERKTTEKQKGDTMTRYYFADLMLISGTTSKRMLDLWFRMSWPTGMVHGTWYV